MKVYVLQHLVEYSDGSEDVKMIGVYSTYERAKEAVERLKDQPGFKDNPGIRDPLNESGNLVSGFYIDEYALDEDHWREGFGFDPEEE